MLVARAKCQGNSTRLVIDGFLEVQINMRAWLKITRVSLKGVWLWLMAITIYTGFIVTSDDVLNEEEHYKE